MIALEPCRGRDSNVPGHSQHACASNYCKALWGRARCSSVTDQPDLLQLKFRLQNKQRVTSFWPGQHGQKAGSMGGSGRKRKGPSPPADQPSARLGGCEAGAALRGGELPGRRVSVQRPSSGFCYGEVADWAARKVRSALSPRCSRTDLVPNTGCCRREPQWPLYFQCCAAPVA